MELWPKLTLLELNQSSAWILGESYQGVFLQEVTTVLLDYIAL